MPESVSVCPQVSPLAADQCKGRHSSCWSLGLPDVDCPNSGPCCFDGCANTCAELWDLQPTYESRKQVSNHPCVPNPCGKDAMCIPQVNLRMPSKLLSYLTVLKEGRPFCKCPEGFVPDPSPEIQCSKANPCNPNPCGRGTTCSATFEADAIHLVCRCLPGYVPNSIQLTGN